MPQIVKEIHLLKYSYQGILKLVIYTGLRWWLMPVIPDTWEAEIRRIVVSGQPGQIVHERAHLQKYNQSKMDWR
jgi:hypothetical protein